MIFPRFLFLNFLFLIYNKILPIFNIKCVSKLLHNSLLQPQPKRHEFKVVLQICIGDHTDTMGLIAAIAQRKTFIQKWLSLLVFPN